MANKKTTSKNISSKKPAKRKAVKKIKNEPANPQITDAVNIIETDNKVYAVAEPAITPTPEYIPPTITNEDIQNRAQESVLDQASDSASYNDIKAPQGSGDVVLYVSAAVIIMVLAWMLVF